MRQEIDKTFFFSDETKIVSQMRSDKKLSHVDPTKVSESYCLRKNLQMNIDFLGAYYR